MWGFVELLGLRVHYPETCQGQQLVSIFDDDALGPITTPWFVGVDGAWAPGFETCRNTEILWRRVCHILFAYFFICWAMDEEKSAEPPASTYKRSLQRLNTLVKTFALDVLGGAAAVWGCSEVVGTSGGHTLRLSWDDEYFGQPSFDRWRIICGGVYAFCLIRWSYVSFAFVKQPAKLCGKEGLCSKESGLCGAEGLFFCGALVTKASQISAVTSATPITRLSIPIESPRITGVVGPKSLTFSLYNAFATHKSPTLAPLEAPTIVSSTLEGLEPDVEMAATAVYKASSNMKSTSV